ncbi:Transmembrane protein 205 [Camellia lanceoleosa]|uniref:Transmembrane protein 205 n=1 Tax=Camellia lanceoleosa TaxID=1840588 RepID=A0ACC0GRX3_9ERIC|nr:Transmembrane protein 205 [Camellia lanceoleosa]
MMNALALCLVLISLVTAPIPSPVKENNPTKEEDVIVKEGHRVVVVEFDKQDGNTKVSISPHESQNQPHLSESHGQGQSPRELVCNALGKCKHKVATALGKTKDMLSDKAHDVEEQAAETVSDALGKAKEAVSHKTSQISDKASEVEEAAKEAVGEVSGKAKEAVSDKARRVGGVKEMAAKAKGGAHNVFESAKEQAKEKQAQQGSEMAEQATETVKSGAKRLKEEGERELNEILQRAHEVGEKAEQAKETVKTGAKKVKEGGEKEMNNILRRGQEVSHDVLIYLQSMMSVVHLLGFATAYGMCMWVTFLSSYVLAGALPRQQFGVVQSKIYPVYFRAMAYSILVALLGHLLGKRKRLLLFSVAEMFVVYHLVASLVLILVNLLYLEPRATKVMIERMKIEKEEGRVSSNTNTSSKAANRVVEPTATPAPGADITSTPPSMTRMPERAEQEVVKSRVVVLNARLKKLNTYSSFLNVLTLMVLSWHLVYLGQLLYAAAC